MRTAENDNIRVEYKVEKDSFSHAFGVQKTETTEIEKVEVYVPAIDEWLDVTHMSGFESAANALIEKSLGL